MATETKTFYPGAHEGLSSGATSDNMDAPVGKGANNETHAVVGASKNKTAHCFWPFDVSVIPVDAEIDSVSCVASGYSYATGNVPANNVQFQLYSGNTPKGEYARIQATNKTTVTLTTGEWTRSELNSIRLRTYVDAPSSYAGSLRFYGADLTVTYTYQGQKFMLKLSGSYHDIARVFKKINGIWVEQTDLENVIEDGVRYQNGGEYVVELPEGYTRLEYIESTGSQYIDTGFKPNQNTRVVVDVDVSGSTGQVALFGSRSSSTNGFLVFTYTSNNGYQSDYGAEQKYPVGGLSSGRHTLDKYGNLFYVDSQQVVSHSKQTFQVGYNVFLCAINEAGSVSQSESVTQKLYAATLFDGGVLVRKFIPCTNPSGVPGMYDLVNDVFYQSASGTAFNAGPVGGSGGSSLISFSVKNTTYQASQGMTWAEFVASEYNTNGFTVDGSRVYAPISGGRSYIWYDNYSTGAVAPGDIIVPGRAYTHAS